MVTNNIILCYAIIIVILYFLIGFKMCYFINYIFNRYMI